ncbi:MAG: FAD-dependent oxidoreductase [Clostridiales bacterium]|nr:FAD-dependent oxidoreductase [Clostridiales bacterium]
MNKSDVVIAGGGLGGLFSGAILARNGLKVIVLEKNAIPGGGLQSFERNGVSFDTGMHVVGGVRNGGSVDRILRYLGVRDRLQLCDVPDDCMDQIFSLADAESFRIPSGKDSFIDYLSSRFPSERLGIERYVETITEIADSFDLFNLRAYRHVDTGMSAALPQMATMPVDRFIDSFVSNTQLRALLGYINGLYAGEAGRTPAYVHALIMSLYLKGASRFVNNTRQLATLLESVISDAGGKVICNSEVVGIEVNDNRRAIAFIDKNKNRFEADKFVWAAHPSSLISLIPSKVFSKAYCNRVLSLKPTCSAFSIFIDLIPGVFPYIDHTCYIHNDMSTAWNLAETDDDGIPVALMFMTPPVSDQGLYASKMLVTALMDFECVRKWDSTEHGHRPAEYECWKKHVSEAIIAKIACVYPQIKDAIRHMYTASPLTVKDYYGAPCGAVYGFSKDAVHLVESQLPVVTKSPNIFLTGQCVNLHGFCGVPLTAVATAEAILYPKSIIDCL